MKKCLLNKGLMVSLAMLAASTSLWGQEFTEGSLKYTVTGAGNNVAVSYASKENTTGNITVPSTVVYEGVTYTVTDVAERGFNYSKISGITLPSTVTSIGSYAFAESKSLKEIVIPKSVSKIGEHAFEWCENTLSISFEAGSALTEIANHTFKGCAKVSKFEIPEGVKVINDWALERMSSMGTLTLPASLERLGDGCFAECVSVNSVIIRAVNPPAVDGKQPFKNNFPLATSILYVPEEAVAKYKGTSPYSQFGNIMSGEPVSFDIDGLTYLVIDEGQVMLTGADAAIVEVRIPDAVMNDGNKYSVVSIGGGVFSGRAITSVELPSGLKSIGDETFYECNNLKSITLPGSLETIGSKAFYRTDISEFVIPNSVTSMGKQCLPSSTASLILSENCPVLPQSMCTWSNLTSIIIPEGVTTVGNESYVCNGHVTDVSLPSTLTRVGEKSFGESKSIRSVVCAAKVAPAGGNDVLFDNDVYNNATLYVPVGSKSSYQQTEPWSRFSNIEERDISTSKEFIDGDIRYAIINSQTVKVVGYVGTSGMAVIPNAVKYNETFVSVVEIGEEAFVNSPITSVEIGQSVKTIGSKAFAGVNLTRVKVYSIDAPSCAADAFSDGTYSGATLYVSAQCKANYETAAGWKNFKNIVEEVEVGNRYTQGIFVFTILEDECVSVGLTDAALKDNTITEITVPETTTYAGITYTVTRVSSQGFKLLGCPGEFASGTSHVKDCVGTVAVTLPETIEEIGEEAFMDAHVKSVNLPASLAVMEKSCFQGSKITGDITIPDGIVELPADAFSWTWGIGNVVLPYGIESLGEHAFMGSRLTGINIPSTVGVIDDSFSQTMSLAKVEIEDLEAYLGLSFAWNGSSPFMNGIAIPYCDGKPVTEIDFTKYGFAKVGDYLFSGCTSLEKLVFPDYFELIGYKTFEGCTNIKTIISYAETPIECSTGILPAFSSKVYQDATLYIPELTRSAYKSHAEWGRFQHIVEMDDEFGGIDEVDSDNNGIIVSGGEIANPLGHEVKIYDVTGRIIYSGSDTVIKPAVKGVVIVKCNNESIKAVF